MLHLFQAFGGPGRKALGFAPTYSMYPEYARDTFTEWVVGEREEDFTLDPAKVTAGLQRGRPALVLLGRPNKPPGNALPLEAIGAVATAARNRRTAGYVGP